MPATTELKSWLTRFESQFGNPKLGLDYFNPESQDYSERIALARRHVLEAQTGSPNLQLFLEIGFSVEQTPFGPALTPPKRYLDLFAASYATIFKKNNLDLEAAKKNPNLILPAIELTRNVRGGEIERLILRPGIDPLPSTNEGWSLFNERSGLLTQSEYAAAMAGGKAIQAHDASKHDPHHILDSTEDVVYAAQLRAYYRAQLSKPLSPKLKEAVDAIDLFVNEFNFKVRANSDSKIIEVFGDSASSTSPTMKWASKNLSELMEVAEKLNRNFHTIYQMKGGGARDGSWRGLDYEIYTTIGSDLIGKNDPSKNSFSDLNRYEVSGRSLNIEYSLKLLKMIENGSLDAAWKIVTDHSKPLFAKSQLKQVLGTHLRKQIMKLEHLTLLGQSLSLTPTQFVKDLTNLFESHNFLEYKKSKTFRYFSEGFPVESPQYKAFVLIATD